MMSVIYLSQEGLDNLKSELNKLKSVDRPNIINQIAEARDKGDLSENAEYDAAKEAQGLLEARIVKLENDIANSRVLDKITDTSTVHLLTEVVIKNLQNGMEMKYAIVSESEADLKNKKISVESPIGKGLMGKSVGDVARIEVPSGVIEFKIMQINAL
ncbi:MAG: transcription elongation factor GreA [Flavobacteriales bacterium]|nr:transcription elongation factor GreA [Flavobacteriales bacterium]